MTATTLRAINESLGHPTGTEYVRAEPPYLKAFPPDTIESMAETVEAWLTDTGHPTPSTALNHLIPIAIDYGLGDLVDIVEAEAAKLVSILQAALAHTEPR